MELSYFFNVILNSTERRLDEWETQYTRYRYSKRDQLCDSDEQGHVVLRGPMWAVCSTEILRSPRAHNGPAHWLLLQRPRFFVIGQCKSPYRLPTRTLNRPLCACSLLLQSQAAICIEFIMCPRCVFSFVRSYFRTPTTSSSSGYLAFPTVFQWHRSL